MNEENEQPKLYTRDQVAAAVNAGADLVNADEDFYISDRMLDVINLIVNAQLSLLDDPGLTLDEVIEKNYEADPATVRGWIS